MIRPPLTLCLVIVHLAYDQAPAAECFTNQELTTPGLVGSYVNRSLQTYTATDDWRTTQTVSGTRTDADLSFTTGTWGSRAAVGITGGSDANWENFSVQWDGWLRVTTAGEQVGLASDDGSRMWIDLDNDAAFEPEELVDNGWGRSQGVTSGGRSRALPSGSYRIRIQYYEGAGDNRIHLTTRDWVPRQFVPAAGNPRQVVRVVVLNFEPRVPSEGNKRLWEVFNWSDPRVLMSQFENDLEFATGGAIDIQIVEVRHLDEFPIFTDGFRYNPDEYVQNRRSGSGWRSENADFYRLAERQGLAAMVNSGQIDEIWCFGDHFFSLFGEAWMAGPNSFFINGPSFPDIGMNRAVAGYGFNYERGVAEMIHNLGHRTENHGQRAFGGWNLSNPATVFDRFSANFLESPGRTAGVGTCHVPANADGHYDYANTRVVQSSAFDWPNYPNLTGATTAVGRDTWGMGPAPDYHRDYLNFYFGMMPRNAGTASDGRQANWFKYIWDFNSYEPSSGLPRNEDAFGGGPTITTAGGSAEQFTVRYYDVTGLNTSTIDDNDVKVRAPDGTLISTTLVEIGEQVATSAGTARTATYQVNAPGGTWDLTDVGSYTIVLQAGQVRDTLGNSFPAGDIGWFKVNIADPSALNISAMLANGQATKSHTTIDIGPIGNLFDGNTASLIRTPNVDPAVVTLTFTQPQTLHGFRTLFSYAAGSPAYQWRIETADNQADLDSQTGSWRLAVPLTGSPVNANSTVMLGTPVTARVVRLWATKVTGDDYVHINEWQLLGPPVNDSTPPNAIGGGPDVSLPGGTAHFVSVTYQDSNGVEVPSLDTGDIVVSGPNGFSTPAVFYDVDDHATGSPRAVTYWFIPPGGSWDSTDNGTYALALQAGQVRDTSGNAAAAQTLGSFVVNISPPVRRPPCDLTENNASLWLARAEGGTASTFNDTTRVQSGTASIRFETDGGFDTWLRYPPDQYADWDLSLASNLYFRVYAENPNSLQFQGNSPWIRLTDTNGGWFEYRYFQYGSPSDILNTALNQWRSFTVPLRATSNVTNGWRRTTYGSPRLDHIASVEFHADTWGAGFKLWYDRVGFDLPVRVLNAEFDEGPPQQLRLTFDQPVGTTLSAGDLQLQNMPGGPVIPPAGMAVAYDTVLNTATITFPGQTRGLLPGGQYRLTLASGSVEDPAGNSLSPAFVHDFTVPPVDITRGIVAYYPFKGNAGDASGNGHDGVVNGAMLTSDRSGGGLSAFSFDGADDYIQLPVLTNTNTFTLSSWVKPYSFGREQAILGSDDENRPGKTLLLTETGVPCLLCVNPVSRVEKRIYANTAVSMNEWQQVACSVNQGQATFYINGVAVGGGSGVEQYGTSWRVGVKGANVTEMPFHGEIDDVRVYDRALSSTELAQLHAVESNAIMTGPEIEAEQPAGTNLNDGGSVIDFGSVTKNAAGPPRTFTIRNTGTADLTGLVVTKDGSGAAAFQLDASGLVTTLVPGASMTFTVTFAPDVAGTCTAAIHVASNDADENPFDIALTGTGTNPLPTRVLSLSGDLAFGNVAMGASTTATMTIGNSGNSALSVTGIVYPAGFSGNWAGGTIAANGSQVVTVTFSPSAATGYGGTITVNSDMTGGSNFISCSGTGTAPNGPEIAVEQPAGTVLTDDGGTVNFGTFAAAAPVKTFTIRNIGSGELSGVALTKDGTHGTDFVVDASGVPETLAPGASATFTVTFRPGVTGTKTAAIHIASNDADENPFDINLSATAGPLPDITVEVPKGVALSSGGTKAFGTTAVGKKATLSFAVKNTGTANLAGTTVALTGPNATEFKLTANVSAPIKPGKSKTFKVQFAPLSPGVKTAVLTITSNDPDESPYLVNLTGTAVAGRGTQRDDVKDYPVAGDGGAFTWHLGKGLTGKKEPAADDGSDMVLASTGTVDISDTTWKLPMTSRTNIEGVGEEEGQGTLRLTFQTDGDLRIEDDSGVALEGTWTVDDEGGLSAQVFPQSVEDYLRAAFKNEPGFAVTVDSADLMMGFASGSGGAGLSAVLDIKATSGWIDADTNQPVTRWLRYHVTAAESGERTAPDTPAPAP